jgi:hypothetical protein
MASKAKTSKSPTREKTPVKEGFESKEWIEYLKVNPEHELHRKWYCHGEALAGLYYMIISRMYDGPFKAFENERNASKLIKPKSINYGEFWIDWVRDTESKKHAEFAKWLMTTSDPDAIIWQNRLQFATDYKALVACIENKDIDMRLYLLHYSKMYNRYVKKGGSIDIRIDDLLDEKEMEDLEDDHKSKKEAIGIAKIPATKKET